MACDLSARIETLVLCGCSRCGRRLIGDNRRLPCLVDGRSGAVEIYCWPCAVLVEGGRAGEEAALNGQPLAEFQFETEAEREAFEAEYRRTEAMLARTAPSVLARFAAWLCGAWE